MNAPGATLGLRGETIPLDEPPTSELGLPASSDAGAADNGTAIPGVPNYGTPKPPDDPTKRYPGRPKVFADPLPPLVPYPTSASIAQHKYHSSSSANPEPAPTTAVLPSFPKKRRRKVETDPFAPAGVDIGSLRFVPYVEVDTGYDSNPNQQSHAGRGSPTLRGEMGFTLLSDWSVHQLKGEFHAGYTDDLEIPMASSPDGNGKLDLRLDATRDTAIDVEARGKLETQSAGSPILGTTRVSERPLVASFGGTLGLTQKFGEALLAVHGTVDRTDYSDATRPDGSILALSAESYFAYGLKARAGYELTPGVEPFLEADIDERRHDQARDPWGFARNSKGVAAQAGSTFELDPILTGEIAAGYGERKYADPRLARLHGPTFNASLVWSVTPLTTVTLKGTTELSETTVAYSSGAVSRTISLELAHRLFRNLELDAIASYGTNTYQGVSLRDKTYTGRLSAEYDLSRSLVLKASASYHRFLSTAIGADFSESKFVLGLKVRR